MKEKLTHPKCLYIANLRLARMLADGSMLERVLEPLGDAVRVCAENVTATKNSSMQEYTDAVVDEESTVIESLIGAAFVVCQAQLNGIVSCIIRLNAPLKKGAETKAECRRATLVTTKGNARDILASEEKRLRISGYSRAQVIDAFANYFKHHEGWPASWTTAKGQAKHTSTVIMAVGAEEASSGNLRIGLRALGIPGYELSVMAKIVGDWAATLINAYEQDLARKHLLIAT